MDFSDAPRLTKARSMWVPGSTHSTKSPKLELSFLLNHQDLMPPVVSSSNSRRERKEMDGISKKKERKFACDQCPAAFTQSHDLSKHVWYVLKIFHFFVNTYLEMCF